MSNRPREAKGKMLKRKREVFRRKKKKREMVGEEGLRRSERRKARVKVDDAMDIDDSASDKTAVAAGTLKGMKGAGRQAKRKFAESDDDEAEGDIDDSASGKVAVAAPRAQSTAAPDRPAAPKRKPPVWGHFEWQRNRDSSPASGDEDPVSPRSSNTGASDDIEPTTQHDTLLNAADEALPDTFDEDTEVENTPDRIRNFQALQRGRRMRISMPTIVEGNKLW